MLIRRNPAAKPEGDPAAVTAQQPAAQTAAPPAAAPQPQPAAAPPPAQPQPAAAAPAQQQPAPGTAVMHRAANAGAVSTHVKPTGNALDSLKNIFHVEYDTFVRMKSGAGNIEDSDGNSLGEEIEMTLVSWQDTWDISPGSDEDSAKPYVRYSDDGLTIKDDGRSVTDYLNELRSLGYTNCNVKQKAVLVGILEASAKPTNLLGQTVQLSLSNQSRKTFDRYRFDRTLQAQMGKRDLVGVEKISVRAEPRKTGKNNWTLLIVSDAAAA